MVIQNLLRPVIVAIIAVFSVQVHSQEVYDSRVDLEAFQSAIFDLADNGAWGGSYDAKYFSAVEEAGKKVFYFSEDDINKVYPRPGEPSPVFDLMNIQFALNPNVGGTISYIYDRNVFSGQFMDSETDFQVCQYANPNDPSNNSKAVRSAGEPLPRNLLFKQEALDLAVAQFKSEVVEPQLDAKFPEILTGDLEKAYDQAMEAAVEQAMPKIKEKVEAAFSAENFSKKLYGADTKDPSMLALPLSYREQFKLGDEVIAVIKGKFCFPSDAKKSWNELVDLNVPVVRADIVDGVLYMRAVLKPFVYGNKIAGQGYSLYTQTPGFKKSLQEVNFNK